MNRRVLFGSFLTLLLTVSGPLGAQSPAECAPTEEIHALRLLRQSSLDLRGHVATYEELQAVQDAVDPVAEVDRLLVAWSESDDFHSEIRRQHRAVLWGNLSGVEDIVTPNYVLRDFGGGIYARLGPVIRQAFRGGRPGDTCVDQRQTRFDADGRPIPISGQREGWVEVEPYWAPGTTVKVCAYDAMDNVGTGTCDVSNGRDTDCGCGPNLRRCNVEGVVDARIREALADEPARIFEQVVREGRPYHEAFTTRSTQMNGPLAHYYRHLRGQMNNGATAPVLTDPNMSEVPNIAFTRNTWSDAPRDEGHAGVLTTAGYLMRLNSYRARANRFYTAFRCEPFVPLASGLPAEEEEPNPNLRERSGCADCHEVLEPAAAHWGRWRINTSYGFFDDATLDLTRPLNTCSRCGGTGQPACSVLCNTYYVTPENSHADTYATYGALPLASIYLSAAEREAFDEGPAGLVDDERERAQVGACAVRTLATRLLGRPVDATEVGWLAEHVEAFEASGYDYAELVVRLARDAKYRAID